MPDSPLKTLVPMLALLWVSGPVQAVEFGAASTTAVLGAPLEFEVGLNWTPGDEVDLRCVAADVAMGGVLVPSRGVSVGLRRSDSGTSVRVRTAAVVHDPVVGVVVSVGCPARLTRRFTVLADPPAAEWAVQATPLRPRQDEVGSPSPLPRTVPLDRAGRESPAEAGLSGPASVRAAGEAPGARGAAPAAAHAVGDSRSRLEVAAPVLRSGRGEPGLPPAQPSAAASAPTAVPGISSSSTSGSSAAEAVAASALPGAGASTPAPDAAAVAASRVQSLENSLLALRIEARQQRDTLKRLEAALGEAESQSRLAWSAAALLAVALAVVTALGMRRRRSDSGAGPRWKLSWPSQAAPAPTEPAFGAIEPAPQETSVRAGSASAPYAPVEPGQDEARGHQTRPAGGGVGTVISRAAQEEEGESAVERTRLMAPSAASISAPLHAVLLEEVLDLEQQVEFLTVLGREDSAVELLTGHLGKTGGTYPTPFLKLMELHRRRGEREAYERVRARFNQRFNAVAAAFGAAVTPQRTLQECPELMRSIERAWPRPLDAVTLLENLMFRSAAKEPLDIAALEEVVFLHALARDLDQRDVRSSGPVDVLLPLDEAFTAPARTAADPRAGVDVLLPEVEATTVVAARADAAKAHSDPWRSISEADFNVGGLELEPLAPLPDVKAAPRNPG